MSDDTLATPRARRALIEVSPQLADRLRDPRLLLAGVAFIAGAVALFVGYLGVSGTLDPAKQLPYLVSGGIGGLFLLGSAAALLFSADLGATRSQIGELQDTVDRLTATVDELNRRLEPSQAAPTKGRAARSP